MPPSASHYADDTVRRGLSWLRSLVMDEEETIHTGGPPGEYAVTLVHTAPDGAESKMEWHRIHVGPNDLCHLGQDYQWPDRLPVITERPSLRSEPTTYLRLLLTGEALPLRDGSGEVARETRTEAPAAARANERERIAQAIEEARRYESDPSIAIGLMTAARIARMAEVEEPPC